MVFETCEWTDRQTDRQTEKQTYIRWSQYFTSLHRLYRASAYSVGLQCCTNCCFQVYYAYLNFIFEVWWSACLFVCLYVRLCISKTRPNFTKFPARVTCGRAWLVLPLTSLFLSPVHTSNNVEATFDFQDFIERIVRLVAFDNVA